MGIVIIFIFLIVMFLRVASAISGRYRDTPRSFQRAAFALGHPQTSMPVEPVLTPVENPSQWRRLPQIKLDFAGIVEPSPVVEPATEVLTNFNIPPSKTEESLLFRSLVLGMFALGVISVDLAAGTHYSSVGIPFALLGNAWSWHRRHHARHWLNILVSVGSLAILFGGLVPILVAQMQVAIDLLTPATKMSGTLELALGMLLVSLQMGLSFYLYDRRILGYSFGSSAVLISAAASLSQNINFVILLVGFVALGVPTLMLDYRSRLSLTPIGIESFPSKHELSYRHLPWRYLNQLTGIVIGLGIVASIFLSIFHFPDLALKQHGGDNIQAFVPRDRDLNRNPQSPPPISIGAIHPGMPMNLNSAEAVARILAQPGNNNYPDEIRRDNLQLPPELASQIQQFTEKILATSPRTLNSNFDRATYLAEYSGSHYLGGRYTPDDTGALLDSKLIRRRISECPASADSQCPLANLQDTPIIYTAMLRSIGIPSRLRTGAELAQIDPQTQLYSRPPTGSRSQTEVYFPNWGWLGLDTSPNRPLVNLNPQQLAQLKEQLRQQLASAPAPSIDPSPIAPTTARSTPNNSTPQADSPKPFDNSLPASTPASSPPEPPKDLELTIFKAIAIIATIIGGMAWYLPRQRRQQQDLAKLQPVERIYRSMLLSLSKQGRSISPAQTQLEYAQNIGQTEHPQIAKAVWEISQQYTAWRYGKQSIDVRQLKTKLQYLQHLQQLAANRKRQQWFARQKSLWTPKNNLKPRT